MVARRFVYSLRRCTFIETYCCREDYLPSSLTLRICGYDIRLICEITDIDILGIMSPDGRAVYDELRCGVGAVGLQIDGTDTAEE